MNEELTYEEALELLEEPTYKPTDLLHLSKHCRRHDKERRCSARGCSSPTYFTFHGISCCHIHGFRELVIRLEKLDPTEGDEDLSIHRVDTRKQM